MHTVHLRFCILGLNFFLQAYMCGHHKESGGLGHQVDPTQEKRLSKGGCPVGRMNEGLYTLVGKSQVLPRHIYLWQNSHPEPVPAMKPPGGFCSVALQTGQGDQSHPLCLLKSSLGSPSKHLGHGTRSWALQ